MFFTCPLTCFVIGQRFDHGYPGGGAREATMATRKKATRKTKAKRKKAAVKASPRRKTTTTRKTRTISKKPRKKAPLRAPSPKKGQPARRQADFNQADADAARATGYVGGAYRRRDSLLQPRLCRDHPA